MLANNILNSNAVACINITVSNVVFDGAGYTIDGVDAINTYGVSTPYSSSIALTNVTVKNLVVTDWYYGIWYYNAQNGSVVNNTASSNTHSGIFIQTSSNNNTLTNNTASSNGNTGIHLNSVSSNTLTNNTANSNTRGIYIVLSSSNIITNNIVNSNSQSGISLYSSSDYNNISNNTANSNSDTGIYFYASSNNTLTRNIVSSSTNFGIWLYISNDNLIFNNFFNNSVNAWNNANNSWNTTKTSGTNIIGGPYLGGNSWSDYNGTDTNGDGLGDTNLPYNFSVIYGDDNFMGIVNDYLPLTTVSTETQVSSCTIISAPGVYTLTTNILNSSATKCIEITSSNVILDGAGYTIDGIDNSSTYGVYVYNSSTTLTNVTVKNLVITDWWNGILFQNVQNGSISNNTASSNSRYAIRLLSSSNITLISNTANSNIYGGILLYSSNSNTLSKNTASANSAGFGILLESSSSNTISNNIANSNLHAIYLSDSSNNNIITSNTANSSYNGIVLFSSNNNTLTSNTASSNFNHGIVLYTSNNNNTLSNNTANSNINGIWLENFNNNNLLTNNTASSNNNGISLYFANYNNTLTSNTANSNSNIGIYLVNFNNNNVITSNTVSLNGYGISLGYSSNNTLTSNTANSNVYRGIWLFSSSNNNLTNNTASSNSNYGILLESSSNNNIITNNTALSNIFGISLRTSNSNILTSNTANSNSYGIYLYTSNSNTLTSNTANSNSNTGILLHVSGSNILTSNTASSNSNYGILLEYSSNSNILTDNIANSNGYYGIILYSSNNNNILTSNIVSSNSYAGIWLDSSSNNAIFNNFFNNTINARDNGTNSWNTTKTPGTNIIGGPFLGGNFWSDYNGTDSDGDGLGNTNLPYNSNGNIVNGGDYLPLVQISQSCVNAPSGMVGWWPGDGNANDIENGNHGSLVNGATFTAGMVGQAFSLDGIDDYVSAGTNEAWELQSGTFDAWFKTSTTNQFQFIVDTFDFSPVAGVVFGVHNDNRLRAGVSVAGVEVTIFGPVVTDGQWHHAAVTFGNGTVALYLDGAQVVTGAYSGSINYNPGTVTDLIIGAETYPGNTLAYFNGQLDELEVFNRALNASEIQAIYTAGSAGKCKPFSLYEPYSLLPTEKIETGILLDIGSILHTHLVQKANGTFIPQQSYVCGDVNGNKAVNLQDIIYLVNYIFKGGPAPVPLLSGDANNDGKVNLQDIIYLVNYIFKGGLQPKCPPANLNEDLFLSDGQFMEAYGDLQRSRIREVYPYNIRNFLDMSKSAQNITIDGIYPIALAAIKYNSIDENAFDNGLLELTYKNGTVVGPFNETLEEDSGFVEIKYVRETAQGQNKSYLNTSLFFGAGSMREMVYGDSSNLVKLIIPSEFFITNGVNNVENISIRFIGLPKPNISVDEFIPIYLDQVFMWNMSRAKFFNETGDIGLFNENSGLLVANISFIIKAKVDGKDEYAFGEFEYTSNPLVEYQHCSPVEIKAQYPIFRPSWWPSTGYPGKDWNTKPSDPINFFTDNINDKPIWWNSNIPWPTPLDVYGSGFFKYWMGRYEVIHDPQVWGPLYNSDTGAVSPVGSEGGNNWRGGFRTRLYITPLRPVPFHLPCKAVNLIVIVDGFDVKNERTIDAVVGDFIGAIKPMLDKGYDVLVLDYNNNYEGGRDYIQRNGYALTEVLKSIPTTYMFPGYEEHDAIVAGGSMGTQTSRYALAKAEDLGQDHNTGLWIAVDGPFVGAHIPWSLQAFIRFFAEYDISSGAEKLRIGLDSPASRQLLRRGTLLKPDILYNDYYTEVNLLNGGKGLPSKVRTVTIASGSGSGKSTNGTQTGGQIGFPGAAFAFVGDIKTFPIPIPPFFINLGASINAKTENLGDVTFFGLIKKPFFKQKWVWEINAGNQEIDFSPGGYRTSPQTAVKEYNDNKDPKILGVPTLEMKSYFKVHNFIPTFSALYYKGAESTTKENLEFSKKTAGYLWSSTTTYLFPNEQLITDLWYGPEDPALYPLPPICTSSTCMDSGIEQKSPFDVIWYENTNAQHVVKSGQKPPVGAYNVLFEELDRFTSQEEFTSRLLGNSPKEPSHEVFLVGNISGCGQELLTINTFTEKAMVQRFVNNLWIKIWEGLVLPPQIGGWDINKGDKFFLANIDDGDGAVELISLSANVPAWAKVQKLVPNVPCINNPTSYSWQEIWSNNGNGYLGPWKIQYTDIYSFGNLKESGVEKLLVAYPYVGNNARERDYPGAGGRSKASLLNFSSTDGWQGIWNNNNGNLHWMGNSTAGGRLQRWCPIRFGDHLEFGKIFSRNVDALLCVNLIRELFGSSVYKDHIVMLNFKLDNTWDFKWSNDKGFGTGINSWVLGGKEDFFQLTDLNGDGLDELFSVNTSAVMVHRFNTITEEWDGLSNELLLGFYLMQPGDRFYFGNIDDESRVEVIVLNPITKGPVSIYRFQPDALLPDWQQVWYQDDGKLGEWVLYQY